MECFAVYSNEIEGRIDPFYYKKEFREINKILNKPLFIEFNDLIHLITKGETPLWRGDSYQITGIPFLKVQNVCIDGIKGDLTFISEDIHKRMKRSQLKGGEILYTMAGSIGKAIILPQDFGEANINQAIAKIIVKDGVNKKYLISVLNSNICINQAQRNLTTSAQPNINFEQIKSLKIPFPALSIQNHIVQIMDNAYKVKREKEEEAKKLIDSFEELLIDWKVLELKNILQRKIFSINRSELEDALNPERYSDRVLFDESVNWNIISNIGTICRNTFTPENSNPNDTFELMRIDDLENNSISAVTRIVHGKDVNGTILKVKTKDVLIARLGPTIENKKFILAPKSHHDLISSNEFICLRCNKNNNPIFVLELLKTDFYKKLMIQKTRGATPSRRRLSHEDFSKLPFPEIDINIQNKIAEEIQSRIQKAERLKKEAVHNLQEAKAEVEKLILGK